MAIANLLFFARVAAINGLVVNTQMIGIFLELFGFSTFLALAIGFIQYLFLVVVIRMNYEGSSTASFIIDMGTKEILHTLGVSFLKKWSFNRQHDLGNAWMLERNDNDRCLLLEIGPYPKEQSKSILATVAYQIERGWIVESDEASSLRDTIIREMEERLEKKIKENRTTSDDSISRLALSNVKGKAQSVFEVTWDLLSKLSRIYQIGLAVLTILLVFLSIAYFYYNTTLHISSDTYAIGTITLILGIIVDIGVPLREDIAKKRIEELEI